MQDIPSIANMTSARNEFSNLIAQVNQIISFVITGEMGGCDCGDEGCGGKPAPAAAADAATYINR